MTNSCAAVPNSPRTLYLVSPRQTASLSLTGKACALDCAHCNRHYLKQMNSVEASFPAGTKSILLSGGCDKEGRVPILPQLNLVRELAGKYRLNAHLGLVSAEEARKLSGLFEVVSFDFCSSPKIIRKVYKLKKTPADYVATYKNLSKYFPVVPHITIGLEFGEIVHEAEALQKLHKLGARSIVLNVFIPTAGTEMADCPIPEIAEVRDILKLARQLFPFVALGCMRPGGAYREKLDLLALELELDAVVQPARALREAVTERGFEVTEDEECCALLTQEIGDRRRETDSRISSSVSGLPAPVSRLRVSLASAELLHLLPQKNKVPHSTVFLMNSGRCLHDCAFCTQARSSGAREELLSRVSWPEFELAKILAALQKSKYERICLQWVNNSADLTGLLELTKQIMAVTRKPVSVSLRSFDGELIPKLLETGVDKVSLALDIASEKDFKNIKGGELKKYLDFILKLSRQFPGKIGTHLIVGFSETEQELVSLLRKLNEAGVTTSLFAFTPVPGTKLAKHQAPPLPKYRRIQIAFELIKQGKDQGIRFDREGLIKSFGYTLTKLKNLLAGTKVFEVNGCKGCTRPYYNERPGGVIYNWPRELNTEEMEERVVEGTPSGTPPGLPFLEGEELSGEEFVSPPVRKGDLGGHIPYDTALTEMARKLRKNMTEPERLIWQKVLRKRQLAGYKFLRQKPLDGFIADFYCSKLLLVVEIDGAYHAKQREYDAYRTEELAQYGIQVVRYTNQEVLKNLAGVRADLLKRIEERKRKMNL